jgi:hypothetical protein
MDYSAPDLSGVNGIAYNDDLRAQLKQLHEMLGVELTDAATSAMEFGYKFKGNAEKVLRFMSKMAAQFSIALINTRKSLPQMSAEEQRDYESMKLLTVAIGNLQDKLNRLIKSTEEVNRLNEKIQDSGLGLAEEIMYTQEQFRKVRSEINDYGFLSKNPELANIFAEQQQEKREKDDNIVTDQL